VNQYRCTPPHISLGAYELDSFRAKRWWRLRN
jgi:hypothetical protein